MVSQNSIQQKLKSLVYGAAVGDALGVPYEFCWRGEFNCSDMIGGGTHNMPEGTWSDDTSMLLCLAENLAEGFDTEIVAKKFCDWFYKGAYTATGIMFDCGRTCEYAIKKFKKGVKAIECGGSDESDNGNGSLMRIAPLVFYTFEKPLAERFELCKQVSSITHAHNISVYACFIFVEFLRYILQGETKENAFDKLKNDFATRFNSTLNDEKTLCLFNDIFDLDTPQEKIESSGFVLHTLKASIYCFMTTDNFKDSVLKAVNLGHDTDTTACVTGAISGLYYDFENIPNAWVEKLKNRELIDEILSKWGEC